MTGFTVSCPRWLVGKLKGKAMKKLSVSDVRWTVNAEPEQESIKGNCSAIDDKVDAETEAWIKRELDSGNVWAWAAVEVKGSYKGLSASDYLGCCSYSSESDFKAGGYFEDMQNAVLAQLQARLGELVAAVS